MTASDIAKYHNTALPKELISAVALEASSHASRDRGVCTMELVAWLAGEPHSDHPECACPVIREYVIRLNDWGPQWVRDALRDRALKIVGTRALIEVQEARAKVFARAAIETAELVLPIFEDKYPDGERPRKAIQAATDCLVGKIAANAANAAYAAASAAAAYATKAAAYAAASAADAASAKAAAYAAANATKAADAAAYAAAYAAASAATKAAAAAAAADAATKRQIWGICLDALDSALTINEQNLAEAR